MVGYQRRYTEESVDLDIDPDQDLESLYYWQDGRRM